MACTTAFCSHEGSFGSGISRGGGVLPPSPLPPAEAAGSSATSSRVVSSTDVSSAATRAAPSPEAHATISPSSLYTGDVNVSLLD